VDRAELEELHYIAPIVNLASILERGILSKRRARPLNPVSVAMEEVQAIRANKAVPGGHPLHDYVNLYIYARNPMLYKRAGQHMQLAVLRISPAVLDLPGVVIVDGNAASAYTGFWPAPAGLAKVDKDAVFAEYWTHADQIEQWRRMRAKCAEVLVPDRVDARYIIGAYVSCPEAAEAVGGMGVTLTITVDPHLFFRG
jgi:hypothetical protein